MPSELTDTAISLSMVLGHPADRLTLLAALLARCEVWYERALAGESPHAAWAARLDTVGRRVTVTTTTGSVAGMAVGVTPEGALLVRGDDAVEHVIWSGDVTALRRAE
jgi:BirA family biotin operon repressor/biotin-[acetyl-CoA-carboxylase] ligase